jgi:hypothetical protein
LAPPRFVEYAYYLWIFYAVAGVAIGVSVDFLGVALSTGIAAYCIWRLGARATRVYSPIAPPLLCALSSLLIQLAVHHESLMDGYVRALVTWMPALIIAQSL